jgi:Lsr2
VTSTRKRRGCRPPGGSPPQARDRTTNCDDAIQDQTVSFGLGNVQYEVDLSASHADDLRQALAPFTTTGRWVAGPKPQITRVAVIPHTTHVIDPKTVRMRAAHRGIQLSARGRIPDEVLEQYEAAGY